MRRNALGWVVIVLNNIQLGVFFFSSYDGREFKELGPELVEKLGLDVDRDYKRCAGFALNRDGARCAQARRCRFNPVVSKAEEVHSPNIDADAESRRADKIAKRIIE